MNEIYVARAKNGNWEYATKKMIPNVAEGGWNGWEFSLGKSEPISETLFPFIKPGEQWKRESEPDIPWTTDLRHAPEGVAYEVLYAPEPTCNIFYRWTRIATLDDKPEPEELWVTYSAKGEVIAIWLDNRPQWLEKPDGNYWVSENGCLDCYCVGADEIDIPSFQPGMLCKGKKVSEHEYEIISVEECHLPIEVDWRVKKWNEYWIETSPYLFNTNIRITCPFEEKKEEECVRWAEPPYWDKCQQNCCHQCGCKKQPNDKFCRNCGECLKDC
jgi:hypothetical protein